MNFFYSLSLSLSLPSFQHREFRVRGCVRALERERKNVVSSKSAAESFTELSEFSAAIFCCSRSYVRCGTFNISVGGALLHKDLFPTRAFSLLYFLFLFIFSSLLFSELHVANFWLIYQSLPDLFRILPFYRFIIFLTVEIL